MKTLELLDLENISGGNRCDTAWKYVIHAVIAAGVFVSLIYPLLKILSIVKPRNYTN